MPTFRLRKPHRTPPLTGNMDRWVEPGGDEN
jgi:hypothetical protein